MAARSRCNTCGALVGVEVGKKCPPHQARGDRAKCPGSGQATVRL
jgi:hypothetical protein